MGTPPKKRSKLLYAGSSTFFFNILLKKYWFETVSCFWSNLCFAGCVFRFQRLIKKVLICSIYLPNNKNLECGHTSQKKVWGATGRVSTYSVSIFHWKVLVCNFFQLLVESLLCWLFFPFLSLIKKVLICSIYLLNNKNLECGHTSKKRSKVLYAGFLHIPFQ